MLAKPIGSWIYKIKMVNNKKSLFKELLGNIPILFSPCLS